MVSPRTNALPASRYFPYPIRNGLRLLLLFGLLCWQCRTAELTPTLPINPLRAVSLENVSVLSSDLDSAMHVWTLRVPYLTNLRALKPILTLAEGVSVIPHSGETQDFIKPVLYTLTDLSGAKIVYTLLVKAVTQPPSLLLSASADTLEAGQSVRLTGHSFGSFGPDVRLIATGPTNLTSMLTTTLLDSTQLLAELPITLTPGRYSLRVLVRNLPSLNTLTIQVQYPSPQLLPFERTHVRGGDTLQVKGLYIEPNTYQYGLLVDNGTQSQLLEPAISQPDGFSVRLDSHLPAGRYRVQVVNRTEHKTSRDTTLSLMLYDPAKPFITGVSSPKDSYAPGESVNLKTVNFWAVPARFYQLQLTSTQNSYVVNGLYEAAQQQVILPIPAQTINGTYTLRVRLLDPAGQLLYHFDTNEQFVIR